MPSTMAFFRRLLPATVVALICALSGAPALAQNTDLNIESRFDSFVPRIQRTTAPAATETVTIRQPALYEERTVTEIIPERERMQMAADREKSTIRTLEAQSPEFRAALMRSIPTVRTVKKSVLVRPAGTVTKQVTKPREVEWYFIGTTGYSYETNANNSNTNRTGDSSMAAVAALRVKVPVGDQADAINFQVSSTSVRYSTLTSQDADVLVGKAVYGHLISATPASGKTNSNDTKIKNSIDFGLEGKSIHQRGFGSLIGNFLTPSLSFTHANVPLADALCGAKGKESFCYSAALVASMRYVTADITTREYAATKLSGQIQMLSPSKELSFTLSGGADFKYFTHFAGGRRDVIYTTGGELEWSVNDNVSLTTGLNFTYQTSNVATAEWNGFSMGPQVKLVAKLN